MFRSRRAAGVALVLATRQRARFLYLRALRRHLEHCTPVPSGRRAIVFAPHQDDETLGCGGTIAAKRRAGVHVSVVCFGDGGNRRDLRHAEMREAVAVLGVDPSDVTFLDLPEGRFDAAQAAATDAVVEILERERPDEVFVTYRHEPHRDHVAAHEIVSAAVARARCAPDVYEYLVWFWYHWPLAPEYTAETVGTLTTPARGLAAALRLLCEFRYATDITDTMALKRTALERYGSQMQRGDAPGWMTLSDYGSGEWLTLLLETNELFRRTLSPAAR